MLYDSFACGLLGCTLVASVLIDHSGYALVPYQNWPLVYIQPVDHAPLSYNIYVYGALIGL